MVFPTPLRRAAVSYPEYRSPYGPKYQYQTNFKGITPKQAVSFGLKSGGFGAVALFAVIFYASGIPKLQKDILEKIPVIGGYYIEEIPASDNPF